MRAYSTSFVWLVAVAGGCGTGLYDGDTFVVEVRGSKQALESFDLGARDMQVDEGLVFSGGLMRTVRTRLAWSQLESRTFELSATKQGMVAGSAKLKPFICVQTQDFEQRVRSGWRIIETHQAFLEDTGQLELDTDFDHPLRYWCEESEPGGRNGDGTATVIHAEPLCAEEDRNRTEIRITGSLAGTPVDMAMGTCWAVLNDIGNGRISLSLLATTESGTVDVGMTHCLDSPDDVFPVDLAVTDAQGCPTGASTMVLHGATERVLASTSGRWLISSANFSRGGHVTGELDLTVRGAMGEELKVAGPYDLPFLRVPVEGDWHP